MTRRSVPEWIGKTPDTPVPARVQLRVFDRYGGICQITGRKIMPGDVWECDHRLALCNGGLNRESNLQPAIPEAHKDKTREDVKLKAKDDRKRMKHLGIKRPSRQIMDGSRDSKLRKPLHGNAVLRNGD